METVATDFTNESNTTDINQLSSATETTCITGTEPIFKPWLHLLGILLTIGTRKMTKSHFSILRNVVLMIISDNANSERKLIIPESNRTSPNPLSLKDLPHYTTIYRTIRPRLHKFLVDRFTRLTTTLDLTKTGARPMPNREGCGNTTEVLLVPPSGYTRADVAMQSVLPVLRSTCLRFNQ